MEAERTKRFYAAWDQRASRSRGALPAFLQPDLEIEQARLG
jgi:hypothetical protein